MSKQHKDATPDKATTGEQKEATGAEDLLNKGLKGLFGK